jgi:hypothetical protein
VGLARAHQHDTDFFHHREAFAIVREGESENIVQPAERNIAGDRKLLGAVAVGHGYAYSTPLNKVKKDHVLVALEAPREKPNGEAVVGDGQELEGGLSTIIGLPLY